MAFDEIQLVEESYKRCIAQENFFPDFYRNFMGKGPVIVEKFKNTDMNHQMNALKHGLQYMIMFAEGSKIASTKVESLGLTHDRNHRDISPELYDLWMQSLLETIKTHDELYTDELGHYWRNVMSHGIQHIKGMY